MASDQIKKLQATLESILDSANSIDVRVSHVVRLRDSLDRISSSDYGDFLTMLFPATRSVLNDHLKLHVKSLFNISLRVLEADNEKNALIALHIIFDLHKKFRPTLGSEVQPFLDFVQHMYNSLGTSVAKVFYKQNAPNVAKTRPKIPRGLESFKVLTECPLIVMLVFQVYPRFIQKNIRALIPKMVAALELHPHQRQASTTKIRRRYAEFISCQVKTLSFLTYLLRGFSKFMKPYECTIAECVVALLKSCPSGAAVTRKELLVASRHILATDFRVGFYPLVKGPSHLSMKSLQPLAYSTLADLVHHMRSQLTMEQHEQVIFVFSRNINDPSLPLTIQVTSVRLLLNLVDHIFHNKVPDKKIGRVYVFIMHFKFIYFLYLAQNIVPAIFFDSFYVVLLHFTFISYF
eukprot:GSMAST32.ASY1.ANO1.1247.1 assembled CDS